MDDRIQIVSIVGTGGAAARRAEIVRRRSLLERYALLWLLSALGLLVFAVWRDLLVILADAMGIVSAPNALFTLAFAILVLLLHFSGAVSRLADRSELLTQRVALMEGGLCGLQQRDNECFSNEPPDEELSPQGVDEVSARL